MWEKLSENGSALMELGEYPFSKRYGWLQDKYGLSWQITPNILSKMLQDKNTNKVERVTQVFLKMKKLDIETLKKEFKG